MNSVETKFPTLTPEVMLDDMLCRLRLDQEYPLNWVFTVHLDDPSFSAYQAKRNGDWRKEKLRLRWYGDSPEPAVPKQVFVESKRKIDRVRDKRRLSVEIDATGMRDVRVLDMWKDIAETQVPNVAGSMGSNLEPVLISRYRRHRFVDPLGRWRFALDDEIEAIAAIEAPDVLKPPPFSLAESVLEVKGEREIDLYAFLPLGLGPARAFSKYGALMQILLDEDT